MVLIWLALVAGVQAPAQQWVFSGGDADTGFAIETVSRRTDGAVVTVWEAAIPKTPMPHHEMGWVDHLVFQQRYDCNRGTIQRLSMFIYRTDGTLAFSDPEMTEPAVAPPPGSTGAALINLVCEWSSIQGFDHFETVAAIRDAYRAAHGRR